MSRVILQTECEFLQIKRTIHISGHFKKKNQRLNYHTTDETPRNLIRERINLSMKCNVGAENVMRICYDYNQCVHTFQSVKPCLNGFRNSTRAP